MTPAPDPATWHCDHEPPLPWCRKCYLAGKVATWPPESGHGSPVTAGVAGVTVARPVAPPVPCSHRSLGVLSRQGPDGADTLCQFKWLYHCDHYDAPCVQGAADPRPGVRCCGLGPGGAACPAYDPPGG